MRAASEHQQQQQHGPSDLALLTASACAAALVVASLLLLVGVRNAQLQVGYRVHDLQAERTRLRQEKSALDVERATLLRPTRLADLARTTLELGPADASRVIDCHDDDGRER